VALRERASPVGEFFEERLDLSPFGSLAEDALFAEWKRFATENGHEHGTKSGFVQGVCDYGAAKGATVTQRRPGSRTATRDRVVVGISFRSAS
jgi:hypothetical protein